METLTIHIPDRISLDFGDSINKLSSILQCVNKSNATHIVFNFQYCRFLRPVFIGGLAALVDGLRRKGVLVEFNLECLNYDFKNYLNTIFYPDAYKPQYSDLGLLNTHFEQYYSKSYIPLVSFPTSKSDKSSLVREKTLSAVNVILKKQLSLEGTFRDAVYYIIDELSNNVSDHSNVEQGYIFAQYYKSENFMDLCIADGGLGVLDSYFRSDKYPDITTDSEAIKAAIQGKSTKDIPESRGFGLSTSRCILVDELKGKFVLWSGAAMATHTVIQNNVIDLSSQFYFPGSLVALRIPTNNRESFDFHYYTQR